MSVNRRAGTVVALLAAVSTALSAPSAQAATVIATDGESTLTIRTPIQLPAKGACTEVPYRFSIASDVVVATAVIVDSAGSLVARSGELLPGEGTDRLNVCRANLSHKTPPFVLELQLTVGGTATGPTTRADSPPFRFASRTVTCRRVSATRPTVRTFAAARCPAGWRPVST